MRRLVVGSLEALASILFIAFVLGGLLFGYFYRGLGGALAVGIGSFLVGVVVFGGLFLLLEMNERLAAIRVALERSDR